MAVPEVLAPSIRGISYPLSVTGGNLSTSTDYDLVAQHIRSVVDTRYYERVMRADYGIDDFVLSILDPNLINSSIETAIYENVSGVTAVNVAGNWVSQGDDGVYIISIQYSVNGVPQPPVNFTLAN